MAEVDYPKRRLNTYVFTNEVWFLLKLIVKRFLAFGFKSGAKTRR